MKQYPFIEKQVLKITDISDAPTAREQASVDVTMREPLLNHEALAVNVDQSIRIEDEESVGRNLADGSIAREGSVVGEAQTASHKASILRKVIAASAHSLSSEQSKSRLMTREVSGTLPQRAPRFATHEGRSR